MSKFRHEYKYILNPMQEQIMLLKLHGLLQKDKHVGSEGYYTIRSLYFDDYYDTCYFENESGTDPRAKYRIRYYNYDTSRISLEKKIKQRGMTQKQTCVLTVEECKSMMQGKIPQVMEHMPMMKQKLLTEMQMKQMIPKVIVSYERIPFVYEIGNVRITIDRSISASANVNDFLEERFQTRPIMEKGQQILEIKWDEILPSYIKKCLALDSLQWTTFSKYYQCRKYNTDGGKK